MGILTNGLRLLSVLRRPEYERKNIVRTYAKAHSWADVAKLGKCKVDRKGHLIDSVLRQKSTEQDDLVAWVTASKKQWFYKLS